ncbi:hypothetical protein QUC31_004778 [Theobroma cacao]
MHPPTSFFIPTSTSIYSPLVRTCPKTRPFLRISPSAIIFFYLKTFFYMLNFLLVLKQIEREIELRNMDGVGSNVKVVESSRRVTHCDLILRILGLILTLVAAIVTGVDKETKTISVSITKTLPTLHVPVTAKWHYMSAFVYFLISNAVASLYAAASLVASMAVRTSKEKAAMALVILDMTIMGLLFSSNGAAIAVGVLGQYGNSHARWNKVCELFGGFCHEMTAAIILSLVGSLVFFWLVALAILNLHKKSR